MLTYKKAFELANEEIKKIEKRSGISLKVFEDETMETNFGWVFFYQSKKFVETGDFNSMIGGNAPLIVDKNSEEVVLTGTGKDIEFYINLYEKYRNDVKLYYEHVRE